jgi:non-ribosomal peptide synthetase component E (peptide arylation enzyme)
MTLLDIFESEVNRSPKATALIQEDGKAFSYRNIDDIATYLGKELACAIRVAPVDEGRDETPLVAVMMSRYN